MSLFTSRLFTAASWVGGTLLVAGFSALFFDSTRALAPFLFTLGAVLYAIARWAEPIPAHNLTVRRLARQYRIAPLCFVASGAMMLTTYYRIPPFQGTEWQVALLVGCVMEVYAVFRLPQAIKKAEAEKK